MGYSNGVPTFTLGSIHHPSKSVRDLTPAVHCDVGNTIPTAVNHALPPFTNSRLQKHDMLVNLETTIVQAQSYARLLGFSEFKVPTGSSQSLHAHLTGLIAFYSPLAVEARAENDAADFVWPTEALLSDAALVHSLGSLSNAIIHKQASVKANRFNGNLATTWFSQDP